MGTLLLVAVHRTVSIGAVDVVERDFELRFFDFVVKVNVIAEVVRIEDGAAVGIIIGMLGYLA